MGWFSRGRKSTSAAQNIRERAALADAARERGELDDATRAYDDVLALDSANLYALYWLATIAQQRGDLARALELCERGLAIDPSQIGLLMRAGGAAAEGKDYMRALAAYERVRRLDPEVPGIDGLLADQYSALGRMAEGMAAFDRALAKDPADARLRSARLFVLNYASLLSPAQLFEQHRLVGEMHSRIHGRRRAWTNSKDPDRPIRIGILSPDLRAHAVAVFVETWLLAHSRERYPIVCIDTSPFAEDAVTARLRPLADEWHRVGHLADDALADRIEELRIDVLMDLAGHSQSNRILVLARKPAPVLATWLGYLNTTGLSTVDYRITDAYMDPPGVTEAYHTEALVRLPHHACIALDDAAPQPGPLPAAHRGYVTFGSMNQWSKVNDDVRDVWARILAAVPRSRLAVIAQGGHATDFASAIRDAFGKRGVDRDRIDVHPQMPLPSFLGLFRDIDIALDPFPYGGGTTTLHSLWMGVPVVSLAGETAMARNAVGPLHAVGLERLCTPSMDDYVRTAVDLASDVEALRAMRETLRSRMKASPLVDAFAFTSGMQDALRAMWRSYCDRR